MTDNSGLNISFNRAIEAIEDVERGRGQTSLAQLSEAASTFIGADEASCLVWRRQTREVVRFDSFCVDPKKLSDYAEHYAAHDVLLDVGMHTQSGQWLVADELFPDQTFSRNAFLREFLPKYRVGQVMALVLPISTDYIASFSFHRETRIPTTAAAMLTGKTKAFSDAATRALGQTFSNAATTRAAVSEAISAPNCFCALVNASGDFMPLAQAPYDQLIVQNVFSATDGRIRHAQARSHERLIKLVSDAVRGTTRCIVLPGGKSGLLVVEARTAPQALRIGSEALAFVTIRIRSSQVVPTVEDLRLLHDLTGMEALVLQHLCNGLTMSQTAEQLNRRLTTVRSHVASAMSKMRCTRQSDLVRLAMLGVIQ